MGLTYLDGRGCAPSCAECVNRASAVSFLPFAAAIQLPEGCQFRTCFELSAEYANVIINM